MTAPVGRGSPRAKKIRGPLGAKNGRGAFEDGTALGLRYYAFRGGAWLAERLPLRLTDAVANLGGRIAFRLAKPPRRQMVARNMARVAGSGTGEALVKGASSDWTSQVSLEGRPK